MISDLHRRLREATRESHERLELDARVVARAGAPASRRALVEAFHRLHSEAEAALGPWLDGRPDLNFEHRRRLPTLRRDLAVVGGRSHTAVGQLAVTSLCGALGVLYVLEGSTLGGRVIRKTLQGAGADFTGLGFLDPYGAGTGERWRAFLSVLDAEARTAADEAQVVAGALAGFALAERCLCERADA